MEINNRKNVSVKSASIVISAVVIYWILFIVLHELFSIPPFPLTILPMVASAWFWGIKRGLLAGTFIILSSIFFIIVFNLHMNYMLTEAFVVMLSFILGSAAGWVRKLYEREKMHSAMLAEKHEELLREIKERETAEILLRGHNKFDHLIYSISGKFNNVLQEDLQEVFNSSIQIIGEFFEMDRAFFYQFDRDSGEIENQFEWRSARINLDLPRNLRVEPDLWNSFKKRLQNFETIIVPDIEMIPREKLILKTFLQSRGIKSSIVVPVISRNTLIGFLGFDSICKREFKDDIQEMLKIISNIFANAITQKQKAEALLASEERFRLLVQHSTDIIGILDVDGFIRYASPVSKSITGKGPDEWLGKQLYPYLHQDDAGKVRGAIRKFVENPDLPPVKLSLRLLAEDGRTIFLESILKGQLNNSAINGIVCNSRDMSAHFALQEALRESHNFLNAIIDRAGDPMMVKDSNHRYTLVNEAFCRLIGFPKEQLLGRTDIEIHPEELSERFHEKDDYVFNNGEIENFEVEFIDHRGNKHFAVTNETLYQDEKGEKYIIANIRDETKRKELEREINNALMKEKELSEMKSKFISIASHEYRTPLTTILSSTELLELFGDSMTSVEKMEHLEGIKECVKYMTSMLNEVLLINRAESKLMEYNPAPFELIAFCKELLKKLCICSEFEIAFNPGFNSKRVVMDDKLLGHILTNLLSNAVKYSQKEKTVWFNITENNGYLNFEIEDHGLGIPVEVRDRLFEPFFRANNVLHISGSGLGLSIVRFCTELHKGSISFESKPGWGTKFLVSLPYES